jgi:diacylglycerol kinase (ATP)
VAFLLFFRNMRISIIANPISGRGRSYRAIQRCVARWPFSDWDVEILTTRAQNHAGLLAQKLLDRPPDLLAVCGGDGTINEIASHIPNPPFPVAILPAGTANVLARELGLPLDPVRALPIALKRTVRQIDLGLLNSRTERRFLFVAGIGFDAFAVSWVPSGLKKKLGMAAYAVAIVECLRSYSFPEFQVSVGDRTFKATSCLVCNAKSYGGGLLFCPAAIMDDGLLDLLILEGVNRLALAGFLIRAWLGKPATHPWVHRLQARSLRIEGPSEARTQVDGELAGCLPVEIRLADTRFPLVIP